MFIANAFFLIYTMVIVPVQICLWNYEDPCNKFPTLYFDLLVDTFFMVRRACIAMSTSMRACTQACRHFLHDAPTTHAREPSESMLVRAACRHLRGMQASMLASK